MAAHRRQPGRTHLHKPAPNIIHCGGVRCCDRECERRHSRHCCADDGERVACDAVTFDLMKSHRAECSEPFDGCCSVALAKRMPAPVALLLSVGQLHPSDEHNCC